MKKYNKTTDIHSFESFAALDGDGIRYGIFFTGCPLRCIYCHNPDTWKKSGREMSPEEVFQKVRRYKPYFKNKGGVTFSGGEPLLNAAFICECATLFENDGINYAVDTSGCVELNESVKKAVLNAELIILDLKFPDALSYKKYTGGDFEKFRKFALFCSENAKRLWLRTVIVPGINDSEEKLSEYAEFAKTLKFEKYELLGFHTMGFFKYEKLGTENPLKQTAPLEEERLKELQKYINSLI